jgi:glucose/arabinose dehydrogenase
MQRHSVFAQLRSFAVVPAALASLSFAACDDASNGRLPLTHQIDPGVSGASAHAAGGSATASAGGMPSAGGRMGVPFGGAHSAGGAPVAGSSGFGNASGAAGTGGVSGVGGVGGMSGAGGQGVAGIGGIELGPDGCPLVPALKLTRVVTLTQSPMLLTQAAGDPRLFIAERPGRVLLVKDGVLAEAPFLDIRAHVAPEETERGLLSLALHPEFAQNGRFFVVYTRAADDAFTPTLRRVGDLVLAEGKRSSLNADVAEAMLTPLLTVPKSNRFHNGGMIAFGHEGFLLMAVGEDGKSYSASERNQLQQRDNLIGKLLRIDVDAPASRVPGNFANGDPRIWHTGVRNPWRLSFDRKTGDLYLGDVGETGWEEINYLAAGRDQQNLGWPDAEGNHCSPAARACDLAKTLAPIHEFPHSGPGSVDGRCEYDDEKPVECNRAVVGGYVYRGKALPELEGRYFYGDFINNFVESLIVKDGAATCHAAHPSLSTSETPIQGLVSFSEDANGELYVLDLLGNVYRLDRR